MVAPLLLLVWFARREFPWPRTEGPVSARLYRQQLGAGWFWVCGGCTLMLCLLAVGLPVFQLISVKRTWTELPGALAAGQSALWNSFSLAAAAAGVVILFGLIASSRISASGLSSGLGSRVSDFCRWLAWLPFLLPGVLLGIGLIVLLNRPWAALLYQSVAIVILAFVIRYMAVGWNSVAHAFQAVDRDLTDVARLDGASRWQMLRYVQWPQVAPQAAAAWYVVFLLCLWDVESMILVVPPGGETLALRAFNLLHYGHNAQVNALCLALLVLAVAPLVASKAWCVVRGACSLGTHHAPCNTVLFTYAALLALTGCAPNTPSDQAPLQSQLFKRVQIIGSRGVGVGQLNKPRSVAVDTQDNLFVVDMTGRVQKFSSNGVFLLSWQMPQTSLGKPKGMSRDSDGNIIVLEPHYQRVNVFSPEGNLLAQWGKHGTNSGELMMPRAVAVNSRHEVLLSEYGLVERVQEFTAHGEKLLASLGHPGNGPGEFNRPEGLCVDAQDRIYVADSCNHRIQVFGSDGKFLRAYGKAGKGKGELSYPYDICVDSAGRQYVCEFGNSRIQVFDANDQPLEIIGGPGLAPGQFANPWGVALDSACDLYVADSQNHRVQKLIRK
jgi:ABC-type spermidine/putrescine transport system permease subunit II